MKVQPLNLDKVGGENLVDHIVDHLLEVHFTKSETNKRLECPWCVEEKKLPFRTAKHVKLRAHLDRDHKFKCEKCPRDGLTSDKVVSHLSTCQGTVIYFTTKFEPREELGESILALVQHFL